MQYQIKNWERFQHYKYRKPPWIRLYRDLLDDYEWHCLSNDAKATLVMLWLIASEDKGEAGNLPDIKTLSFRLRTDEKKLSKIFEELSDWLVADASTKLADCNQSATPETEKRRDREETETETYSCKWVVDFWNESSSRTGLPRIKGLSKPREKAILARIKEYSEEDLKTVLDAPVHRPFLAGENDSGWKCSFDWLLKPANFLKVLEGNYTSNTPKKKRKTAEVHAGDHDSYPWDAREFMRYGGDEEWHDYCEEFKNKVGQWPRYEKWLVDRAS